MPKADPRPARKRQRSKGRPSARPSKEHQQALDEIDTLRLELIRKDQTIAQLQLNDRDKTKRMDDLHDQIYQLGVANRDLEAEIRNLKLDKERLRERLTNEQQFIIDQIQPTLRRTGDVLGEVLDRATRRMNEKQEPA